MYKGIFNWWHITKARVVVAYAFFKAIESCLCISYSELAVQIKDDILFFIRYPFTKREPNPIYLKIKKAYTIFYEDFFRDYTAHRNTPLADYVYVKIECPALGSYFPRIIAIAWLCEKLGINVQFTFPDTYLIGSTNLFESPVLSYAEKCDPEKFAQLEKPLVCLDYWDERMYPSIWEQFAKYSITSEYGYNIISKLSIKHDLQQQADQWCQTNIKRKCIGVHYRQTDVVDETRVIEIKDYIHYLKQVLGRSDIFACSDNTEFIDAMRKEFAGRVAARDITRSDDLRSIHRHAPYAGHQQRQDALIDMLILARTEIIYTIGSFFIDTIRFFNPKIKIISLDNRIDDYSNILNHIPVPNVFLADKAREQKLWKEPVLRSEKPKHIEFEKG